MLNLIMALPIWGSLMKLRILIICSQLRIGPLSVKQDLTNKILGTVLVLTTDLTGRFT